MATRARRRWPLVVAAGCASVLLVAGVGVAWLFLFGPLRDSSDWSRVTSIERDPRYQDPALLERAWALPGAAPYRRGFESQGNPSFCGPTSLANVSRSLGRPLGQRAALEGTSIEPTFGLLIGGITLADLASVARVRLGRDHAIRVVRPRNPSELRLWLVRAAERDVRVIANFHRGPLFARGGGHHSPLGGLLEPEGLAFVLDTNADYRPWLAPVERLFAAIDTLDEGAGTRRGLLVVTRAGGGTMPR